MKEIIDKIGEAAILEQLAEECAELTKAALKLSRVMRKENPTPVTVNDAFDNLVEEIGDVRLLLRVTDFMYDSIDTQEIEKYKLQRWKNRIKLGDQRALRL
jgi:hypothetical protein